MTQPDKIADLGRRLDAAIEALDEARQQIADVLPAMRAAKHPRLNSYLRNARHAGFTLDELGEMLGCTGQRIHQRVTAGDREPAAAYVIDEADRRKLLALRAQADGRSPIRREGVHAYRAELLRLHELGATWTQLAGLLGVSRAAVWQQIRRHRPEEPA